LTKKSRLKILYTQISNKKMYYLTTILIPFTIRNFLFLYISKYNICFNRTFFAGLLLYISIYVSNANFFEDIEV
jgi:hypothetical protein